jgi:hypothetical protein
MIDFIAAIALFEITINIAAIFIMPSIKWALVARSFNGYVIGTAFLVSALIGRPVIYYISKQFTTGGDPVRVRGFDAVNKANGGRAFRFATLVWAIGIYTQSTLNAVLALSLAPATYLLVSQIVNIMMNVTLIIWSIRFTRSQLLAQLAPG